MRKMAIYWHPACFDHYIADHPEQPRRVSSILDALRKEMPTLVDFREAFLAGDDDILMFHSPRLLEKFKLLANKAEATRTRQHIDGDTGVMENTREAAYRAIGSILMAIDHLFLPSDDALKIDTAFCCVRPPGHHAEPNRACGFCFFGNAAIGAKYAQSKYGVKKVAVLDFDVHHGNGALNLLPF
jgi:acetoin utilization deacetylase AcuC-like enzyme